MGGPVTDIHLKYVHGYRDCRGRMRFYVRRKGQRRAPLPGMPGSQAFMEAYHLATADIGCPGTNKPLAGPRSVSALIQRYYNSAGFKNLSEGSRLLYRKALSPIDRRDGHRAVADLPGDKAQKLIEEIGATHPGMANVTLAVLRQVFKHSIKLGWRHTNPFAGIERYRIGTHHTWTDEEIAGYIGRWPIGTRERMAFDLLYYTAQRVGDVAKMRRADIRGNELHVKQQKTGVELSIPVHPTLRRSLNAYGIHGQHLVGRRDGKPMGAQNLSKLMIDASAAAGLPRECVPHGIRKAVLRHLAEAGASTKVIASLSGHKTLKEIERYTEKADQGRMVVSAIASLPDRSG